MVGEELESAHEAACALVNQLHTAGCELDVEGGHCRLFSSTDRTGFPFSARVPWQHREARAAIPKMGLNLSLTAVQALLQRRLRQLVGCRDQIGGQVVHQTQHAKAYSTAIFFTCPNRFTVRASCLSCSSFVVLLVRLNGSWNAFPLLCFLLPLDIGPKRSIIWIYWPDAEIT